jgi:hypothetical protein
MNQSENINELAAALAKAQGEMSPVYKDKKVAFDTQKNDRVKYKYADLAAVWDSCRQPLSAHGLAVVQTMESIDGFWVLTSTLTHSSGQWMKSMLPINVNTAPAALGSIITYMRRYALCAMVGIAPEDDDGQEATKDYENKVNQSPPKKQPDISNDRIESNEIIAISNLANKLDGESFKSFMGWIEVTFGAMSISNIPKNAVERCVNLINAKIKLVNDQNRVVA